MKRQRLITTSVLSLLLVCALMQSGLVAKANNHVDVGFNIYYCADGSDTAPTPPRPKQDSTASYIKSNAGVHDFTAWIEGTNGNNAYPNYVNCCSSSQKVPSGSYRYFSNTVYGRFTNAYPVITIGQNNRCYTISGKWSPDNISGRY